MEEHREQAESAEREADRLEQQGERVEEDIDETRKDWEAKQDSSDVPGAVPEESDQLPEEGPPEQVPDDEGGESRDEAERNPGVPGEDERGTGHQADETEDDGED